MKKQLLLSLAWLLFSLPLSAQWQHIPGPDGGYVVNLDTDGSQLYALTLTAIYRSDDEGYHWQAMQGSHQAGRTIDRLVAENGVFYGKNSDGEVLRSSDGGQTWQAVLKKPYPITAPGEVLHEVFAKGDTVLVSSAFTIYRSVDRGATWGATSDLFGYGHWNIFSSGQGLFARGNRHIHHSSDGGITWKRVFTSASDFATVNSANGYVFALYKSLQRIVRSNDGFKTWKVIDTDSLYTLSTPRIHGTGTRIYAIDWVYYCEADYAYSDDGGLIWHRGKIPSGDAGTLPSSAIEIVPLGNHLVFAHEKGISHSTDSLNSLTVKQSGLLTASIQSVLPGDRTILAGAHFSAYGSSKVGEDWSEIPSGLNPSLCITETQLRSTRQQWFLHSFYQVKYSYDEGEHWQILPQPLLYEVATSENCLWEKKKNILWRLCDGENQFVETPVDSEDFSGFSAFGQYVIINTSEGHTFLDEKSRVVMEVPFSPCFSGGPFQQGLHFDGRNLFHFCGSTTYIFKENATAWEEIYPQDWTTGIPLYHSRITALATHQGVTWAALEGKGLFYTTDATGRFYPALPQLPYPYPTAISFRDNEIWVGTEGGGIYHTALPPVQAEATGKPRFQCSPNPSDGRLHLQADVFFTKEIPLEVLDVSGKRVAAKTLSPGQAWDLDFPNLPQGMYMLMLRTGAGTVGLKWVVH